MQNKIIKITVTPTDPLAEPLVLSDVKEWLIVEHDEDDTLITNIMKGVKIAFQNWAKICLTEATVVVIVDLKCGEFKIPRLPFGEIVSISAKDTDAESGYTELNADDYEVIGDSICIERLGITRVEYSAGYETIPDDIKIAMFSEIAYRYENREKKSGDAGFCDLAESYMLPYLNLSYA